MVAAAAHCQRRFRQADRVLERYFGGLAAGALLAAPYYGYGYGPYCGYGYGPYCGYGYGPGYGPYGY